MSSRRKFLTTAGLGLGGVIGASAADHVNSSPDKFLIDSRMINVLDHAIGNSGVQKITPTLNKLIEEVSLAGGGTVFFPAGEYLSGAIHLKSNITLHLDPGANIVFSNDFDDYLPMVKSRWQGIGVINFSPLIYAYQVENIAITGQGTLNGMGKKWWEYVYRLRNEYKETGTTSSSKWQEEFYRNNPIGEDQSYGFCRPSLLQFIDCKEILIQGVRFLNSPFWTTHFVSCEDLNIDGISIFNEKSPNTDGINPESSRNVRISNCNIQASDDCITIKAGKNEWGRKNAKPCENITITNCIMTSGAAGVGIGSEVSGDVRRVVVSNCVFDGTGNGIHIKTNRERGGIIEDISISNIVMNNVQRHPAIFINMKYWIESSPQAVSETTPRIQNIRINGISGRNIKKAIGLVGLEEMPIKNVSITQVSMDSEEGFYCENGENIVLKDIDISCKSPITYMFENSKNIETGGLRSGSKRSDKPLILLKNTQKAYLSGLNTFNSRELLVQVKGGKTRSIVFGDKAVIKQHLDIGSEVDKKEIS